MMSDTYDFSFVMEKKDPVAMIRESEQQILADPDNGVAHLHLASWLHTIGKVETALPEYQKSVDLLERASAEKLDNPLLLAIALYWMGQAFSEAGNKTEAINSWKSVLGLYALSSEEQLKNNSAYKRAKENLARMGIA